MRNGTPEAPRGVWGLVDAAIVLVIVGLLAWIAASRPTDEEGCRYALEGARSRADTLVVRRLVARNGAPCTDILRAEAAWQTR